MPPGDPGQGDVSSAPHAPASRALPILIVDDEPAILLLVQQTLEETGYTVLSASTGRVALTLTQQTTVGLVLTDFMMPEMDGNSLCHHLRTDPRTQHVPILLMTAARDPVVTCTVTAIIPKPFDLDDLVAQVRRYYP